jgi:hypothetical protein
VGLSPSVAEAKAFLKASIRPDVPAGETPAVSSAVAAFWSDMAPALLSVQDTTDGFRRKAFLHLREAKRRFLPRRERGGRGR